MKKSLIVIAVLLFLLGISLPAHAYDVFVNQLGYYTDLEKYALIENPERCFYSAEILNANTGTLVLSVPLQDAVVDKFTGNRVSKVDFSQLTIPGTYKIKYGKKLSYTFIVGNTLYKEPLAAATKVFYLQRCGEAVYDPSTGISHPACHLNDAYMPRKDDFHQTGEHVDVVGGWHDAGDFGKYVATTTIAATLLMDTLEKGDALRSALLYFGQTGDAAPDVYEEIKYGIDWLFKMQRPDGAAYRKVSGATWPPEEMLPQNDTQKRYLYGISSQETGKLAGTMARASTQMAKYYPSYAKKALKSAEMAWNYLERYPYYVDFRSTDDSGSGGYPNPLYDIERTVYIDKDERFWAATELFLATNNPKYLTAINALIGEFEQNPTPFTWKDTSLMGFYNLATHESFGAELNQTGKDVILGYADRIITQMNTNPYYIPFDEFRWGSNSSLMANTVVLTYAYELTKEPRYHTYALRALNYIFGLNPLNKSYLTGFGENPPKHTHHRYSIATGDVIPGLLVGGPNNTAPDKVTPNGLQILSYIDNHKSYGSNEFAIDYNAQLIYVLNRIASQYE